MNRIFVEESPRGFANELVYIEFDNTEEAAEYCSDVNDNVNKWASIVTDAKLRKELLKMPRGEYGSPRLYEEEMTR